MSKEKVNYKNLDIPNKLGVSGCLATSFFPETPFLVGLFNYGKVLF